MGARPGDWSALKLSGDPTPGDPDMLLGVADYMDVMARNADTADTGLGAVLNQSGDGAFIGKTADWLRDQITKEMRGFVAGVKQAFTAGGPAIRTYVASMKEAQAKADQALSDAAGAAGDDARLATLTADANSAGSDLKSAGSTLQTTIHNATSYIKSPTTPKSACDIFWEIFGWLTLIISIVAIFIGGPLGLIAFGLNAALAIKSLVDFAEGKTNVLGLVLGLLGVLGPSTRPLIALGDLTKLAGALTKNITKLINGGALTIAKGVGDFWHTVQTINISTVMKGISDIGSTIANTVKIGVLNIPKAITAIDNLAVKGFVALEGFTVHTLPTALGALPGVISAGVHAIPGLAADLANVVKLGAGKVGDFLSAELGGWKALRLFLPVAAHEIDAIGLGAALKLGVLGRGLGITKFSALGAGIGSGIRVTDGLIKVNIVKPGDTPHFGGSDLNLTPSGVHLPDIHENPITGIRGSEAYSFSAKDLDLSGITTVGAHDLAGLQHLSSLEGLESTAHINLTAHGMNGINLDMVSRLNNVTGLNGLPGGMDLSVLGKIDMPNVSGLGSSMSHLSAPSIGTIGSVTLPNMRIGDLTGLSKFTNGVDGVAGFGRPELRSLQTGDISAIKISDTSVSFNLGAPDVAFGGHVEAASMGTLPHFDASALSNVKLGPVGHLDANAMPTIQTGSVPHLGTAALTGIKPTAGVHLDATTIGKVDVNGVKIESVNIDAVNLGHLNAGTIGHVDAGSLGHIDAGSLGHVDASGIGKLNAAGLGHVDASSIGKLDAVGLGQVDASSIGKLDVGTAGSIGKVEAVNLPGFQTGAFDATRFGTGPHALSVNHAMDLLANPDSSALRGLDTSSTHSAVNALNHDPSLAGLPHQSPRPDQAGLASPLQQVHLGALHQLQRAQDALANAGGDALTIARAQKDIKIAELVIKRTGDGVKIDPVDLHLDTPQAIRGDGVKIDPVDLHLGTPQAVRGDGVNVDSAGLHVDAPRGLHGDGVTGLSGSVHLDLTPPKPAEPVDQAFQSLQARLDNLRGADHPASPELAGMELQARFDNLRPTPATGAEHAMPDIPSVPAHSPGDSIAELEGRLTALRGPDQVPHEVQHLELQYRLDQLRSSTAHSATHSVDHVDLDPARFPDVPSTSPAEAIARSTAAERLTHLESQLAIARAEEMPTVPGPQAGHFDDAALQARLDALHSPGDGLPHLPEVPRTDPVAAPTAHDLTLRLDQLARDARSAHLPGEQIKAISADVKTALDDGRYADAATHLSTLHENLDKHLVDQRLDAFRDHVDAGHQRAAELGMSKVDWLEHATGIERAAADGHMDDLHGLLNAYENSLAGHLTLQKLHDLPGVPDHLPEHAGDPGGDLEARLDALRDGKVPDAEIGDLDLQARFDALRGDGAGHDGPPPEMPSVPGEAPGAHLLEGGAGDLQARLDALRDGHTPDPELEHLELQARFDNLRSDGESVHDGALPDFPSVPEHDELSERLGALTADRDAHLGMGETERADWDTQFRGATDEAGHLDVLNKYQERITSLEREAQIKALSEGPVKLPADEHKAWQDALAGAGHEQAGVDKVLSDYSARVAHHESETVTKMNAALSAPDHLRPLNSRVDEGLSGLSQDLRARSAAENTTLSDRLDKLRGPDERPGLEHGLEGPATHPDPPSFPEVPKDTPKDLTGTPKDLPSTPKDLPSTPKDLPSTPKDLPSTPKADAPKVEQPKVETTTGDLTAQLSRPLDQATTDAALPPRDLLGDGKASIADGKAATGDVKVPTGDVKVSTGDGKVPVGGDRVIQVDTERWTPKQDAFHFEPAALDHPPTVTRPAGGGERVAVRYQLTAGDHETVFTLKLHLNADAEIGAGVKASTAEGVHTYLNEPGYRLPGSDVPMRVDVQFVDDPAEAHAQITVGGDLTVMNQNTWKAGASPAAYAHEVVHFLGVKDGTPAPGALLHDPAAPGPVTGDLMGSHGPDDAYVLTPGALTQIADVLAPHFSGSTAARVAPPMVPGHLAEDFWQSGTDVAPNVHTGPQGESIGMVPVPKITITPTEDVVTSALTKTETPKPASALPGFYENHPELLYDVDSLGDVDALVRGLDTSIDQVVRDKIGTTWKGNVPLLSTRTVKAPEIGQALRSDPQSFFTTGGRSFDVQDGLSGWHRVTVEPVWKPEDVTVLDQSADKAKFDTRADFAAGIKQSATTGGTGTLGISAMAPQRIGYGAGGGAEVALSRPLESSEVTTRLTDSHNVRSGSGSNLIDTPVRFMVSVSDVRGATLGPGAVARTMGAPVDATVTFRSSNDIADATPSADTTTIALPAGAHTSALVENFTPTRILSAGMDGAPATSTWNDIAEQVLAKLAPTKAVDPGTAGANEIRELFSESVMISQLMPALDGKVHPPLISSPHGAHGLSLELDAQVPDLAALADVKKSSFRWQPGVSAGSKVSQTSRVGGALSVVPIRWGFAAGYVQFRMFGGFFRSATASSVHGSVSRIGTELKDVGNVAVEAHFQLVLTPTLREVPGTRMPFSSGAVAPMTIDLTVLGRIPKSKLDELMPGGTSTIQKSGQVYPPPYAATGGRSVTTGLSDFTQLQADVTALVRRIEGGFLPKFGAGGTAKMVTGRAAIERQQNQAVLDKLISSAALRQNNPTMLKFGTTGELTRTKQIGTRHIVLHVTSRYVNKDFQHLGTEKGVAVRNARTGSAQSKIVAGSQFRGGATLEGGGVFRFSGKASSAVVPSGGLDVRGRVGQQGGAQLSGSEVRLNGGTPHSQAFGNELEVTVNVYSFTKRTGHDPRSRVGVGRVVRQRTPRPVTGGSATASAQAARVTTTPIRGAGGKTITRYRVVQQRPVKVLFDNASVSKSPTVPRPSVFTAAPDPLGVQKMTQLDLGSMRTWVDTAPKQDVRDWKSVEDMPGSTHIVAMAQDVLTKAQHYLDDTVSRTRIDGLRGTDALGEGMSGWASTIGRLNEAEQVSSLSSMLHNQWHIDKITSEEDGASVDLAISASLTGPEVLWEHETTTITTESASVGGVEVESAKTIEGQVAARANFSTNIRKPGTTESTSGGGGLINAGHERILYAEGKRESRSLAGAIERNVNNRKGKTRTYLVKFDMRVSVAAEITTDPARYAAIPQSLRTGDWLHHYKSIKSDGTISNAVYLRLTAQELEKLSLLPKLDVDPGAFGKPWSPGPQTKLQLAPGHTAGLGLYTIHEAPDVKTDLLAELSTAATALGGSKSWTTAMAGLVRGKSENKALTKISDSLTGHGLDDPMLNRRRLFDLLTPDGLAQHWASIADGGISVLHLKPGKLTQHSRDVRLMATVGEPDFHGFVADHDDLDIKTTHVRDSGITKSRTHGHTETAGIAGTGVSNHHGENLSMGLGDTVGRSSQKTNAQGSGETTIDTELSSGRGVKARMDFPVQLSLVVFDKGKPTGEGLVVVSDHIVQDRWADDLRLPRTRGEDGSLPEVKTPVGYQIDTPKDLGPGWRTLNGLPLPPRFTAEDLTQIAQLQHRVEGLLDNAARRLAKQGYAGAHQIHQSLTPEILLPGVPTMMTKDGLDLPPVVSAQIFGQQAKINLKLKPEAASLGGVSSGVFREHAPQQTTGYSSGTNAVTQDLRAPRIPLIGRGYADDPYQALEAGGPGIAAGDSVSATETGTTSAGALGNVKPESRSAAVDYLSRLEVTVELPRTIGTTKIVESVGDRADLVTVSLRMGLHDARTALDLPEVSTAAATAARTDAFNAIVAHEAKLAKAADAFVKASDDLDEVRFQAYPKAATAEKDLATAVADLPARHTAFEDAGQKWWDLEQQHYQLLDAFRHDHLGLSPSAAKNADTLTAHIQQQTLATIAPPKPPAKTDTVIKPLTDKPVDPPVKTDTVVDPLVKTDTLTAPALDLSRAEDRLNTPGDGRCQLYSVVATDPRLVRRRLMASGLGSPELHAWLDNPALVHTDTQLWAQSTQRVNGLVPMQADLAQAAEQLRTLVGNHLRQAGPAGVHGRVLEQYRNNSVLDVRDTAEQRPRADLIADLHAAGVDTVGSGHLLPLNVLRNTFLEARTTELMPPGAGRTPEQIAADRVTARAAAEQEVQLKPPVAGSSSRDLTDGARSMQDMFQYLTDHHVTFDLAHQPDSVVHDVFVDHYLDPQRHPDTAEFAALTDAVAHWEDNWQSALGEAFLPLLGDALGARMRVRQPAVAPLMFGPAGAPLIDLHRVGEHYNAGIRPDGIGPHLAPEDAWPEGLSIEDSVQQLVRPPLEQTPPRPPLPEGELTGKFGEQVWPKKVKPFELDPPLAEDAKGVKGEALATQEVRLNPAWMPLSDFTEHIWAGRPDATWHYVVTPEGEIFVGSEEILTAVSDDQLADLYVAMKAKDPSLTPKKLRDSINQQGHPTIGARFSGDGRAWAGQDRISGEMNLDPATGHLVINDKSGRYMSGKVRPGVTPAQVRGWLDNVAAKMSEQLGVPVEAKPYKHTGTEPAPEPAPEVLEPIDRVRDRFVALQTARLVARNNDPFIAALMADGMAVWQFTAPAQAYLRKRGVDVAGLSAAELRDAYIATRVGEEGEQIRTAAEQAMAWELLNGRPTRAEMLAQLEPTA